MPCTTILAGKKATADGSTLVARNEDYGHAFNPKRFIVVTPDKQPKDYQSVTSKCKVDLPDNPMRYTAVPELESTIKKVGWWGEAGINEANVAMSATETSTTNSRVLGIDPMNKKGIGEEDFVTIVLPYIRSAREGVKLLGTYLEKYGTYESNGVPSRIKMKFGTWKLLVVVTGPLLRCQMIVISLHRTGLALPILTLIVTIQWLQMIWKR